MTHDDLHRWQRAEQQRKRRARKRGDQIYMSPGFPFTVTAEELLAALEEDKFIEELGL